MGVSGTSVSVGVEVLVAGAPAATEPGVATVATSAMIKTRLRQKADEMKWSFFENKI